MSILKTDWHSLLSPTTTVPPDVTFLVEDELEEGGQGTGKCPQEDWRSQSPPVNNYLPLNGKHCQRHPESNSYQKFYTNFDQT